MKVPGVNAPIPPGAKWGFASNGWRNAPVERHGVPLYGDVLEEGLSATHGADARFDDSIARTVWRWGAHRD